MRMQDRSPSGRRPSSRRGSRHHHQHRRNGGHSRGSDAASEGKAAKLTFWQKIKKILTGNGKPKPAPISSASGASRSHRSGGETYQRSARIPEAVAVTSPKLYVGNLSFDATESDLFDLFNGVGKVQNAEVVSNKYTQRSKGFAFVTLSSIEEARRAVEVLHDQAFMGRKLVVSGAKSSDAQRGEGSAGYERH